MLNTLLAQQTPQGQAGPTTAFSDAVSRLDILNEPTQLLDALANLHIVWASVFVVVGALCVFNGYRWHRFVIVICAFLAGIGLGHVLSQQMGQSRIVVAAIGMLCAVIATPLLRITVALFGGATGAFIGANAWTAFAGTPETYLAGAGMGFIAMGFLAFLMFKVVVVIFTSIGGAAMAVLGSITLLMHVPAWQESVRESISRNELVLPLLITTAAVTGFVMQHNEMKRREEKKVSRAAKAA